MFSRICLFVLAVDEILVLAFIGLLVHFFVGLRTVDLVRWRCMLRLGPMSVFFSFFVSFCFRF